MLGFNAIGMDAIGVSAQAVATDASAPTLGGSITITNITTSGARAAWPAGTDNVAVSGYELSCDTGNRLWVDVGNVLTADIDGKVAGTNYTVRVRAYDAAGNRSGEVTAPLTTAALPPDVQPSFTPSAVRTIKVQAASRAFTGGDFWDLVDAKRPRGIKDPNSTIDVTFDWSEWLADMGSPAIASVVFILGGLQNGGSFVSGVKTTIFAKDGSGDVASITCRVTTASTPARTDDRTVYLDLKDQ